ncbi:MAG: hypothetical protein Q8N47_05115 [Bryobacterales bacterium]|nr:hypothetical protein [Bryobacterales bacterium]
MSFEPLRRDAFLASGTLQDFLRRGEVISRKGLAHVTDETCHRHGSGQDQACHQEDAKKTGNATEVFHRF